MFFTFYDIYKTRFSVAKVTLHSVHFKKTYQCKLCFYQATQNGSLSKHVKNVHQKSENVNCSECNKCMKKISLKGHIKVFHSGD